MLIDKRLQEGTAWLTNRLRLPVSSVHPLAGDASFRRYFRVTLPDACYILMDAPPSHEDCRPFVAIDRELIKNRVHAPQIIGENLEEGFLLLEDFGDNSFLTSLNSTNLDVMYRQALDILVNIQKIKTVPHHTLPVFDTAMMMREMMLFQDWFIQGHLNHTLEPFEKILLEKTFQTIALKISQFKYTFTHRDFHSRNLMLLSSGEIGILDFQDAVIGPLAYDAISLLKDCYIALPRDKVIDLLGYYHHLLTKGKIGSQSLSEFVAEFDWVGIQRHIKVVGIFSRLALRDGKKGYLNDIPLAMKYLLDALNQVTELNEFRTWLEQKRLATAIPQLLQNARF